MSQVWVLAGLGVAGLLSFLKFRKPGKDAGAFIEKFEIVPPPPPPAPLAPHPLAGLTFAVKDIFDIEGRVTGFGNPDWAKTHEEAKESSPAVLTLVNAGAKCVGKTFMDELAFSINGENKHFGTPRNPAAPGRVPGGSSSGSAVAVASGVVDFALGTDTCGSVRLPAAYCGILGFRPSHGVISTRGVVPMSPSLDTVGWFARDATLLQQVGQVLLGIVPGDRSPQTVYVAQDLFDLSDIPRAQVIEAVKEANKEASRRAVFKDINIGSQLLRALPSLAHFLPPASSDSKLEGQAVLTALRDAMRALQCFEFKTCHEEWLTSTSPDMAEDIRERVDSALLASPEQAALALQVRDELRKAMKELMKGDTVLVMPTAPGLPPKLRTKASDLASFRSSAFVLLAVAGFSGCPQLTIPAGTVKGAPVAVSLVAAPGADSLLLGVGRAWAAAIREAAERKAVSGTAGRETAKQASPAEVAKEKGNKAFNEGKFKEAVDHYTQAIKLDGKNATLYSNRAMAYLKLCNFHKAEIDCDKALEYDQKNVKAWLRRGTAREYLGVYNEALNDFEHALVLEPTNKMAQSSRKRIMAMLSGTVPCDTQHYNIG